jgi:meromycolic acid (3R)-3-hydroxyacyl-[acyl-carrier protein] dehydratase HadAB
MSAALRFDDLAVGDEVPAVRRVVTRDDLHTYAEVGGDRNPLHRDDDVARAAGFPGIIAHGMFTMGHMAACIAAWAGTPESISSLSAQFREPVFLGEEIVAAGRIRALDPVSRTAVIEAWVTVERDGRTEWPVKRGEAVLRLP